MTETPLTPPEIRSSDFVPQANAGGCARSAMMVVASLWVVITSGLILFLSWSLEQTMVEGSLSLPDIRWLFLLLYAIGILVPFGVLAVMVHNPRDKSIFTTLALAGGASILIFPARLTAISDSQLTAVLHIGGMLVFLLGFLGFTKIKTGYILPGWKGQGGGAGLAWIMAGISLLPWVLWGALGSPLDTLLGLIEGVTFGAVLVVILRAGIFKYHMMSHEEYQGKNFWMDSWITFMVTLILVTGLGQNGNQWMLAMLLPVMGWGVVGLARTSRDLGVTFNGPAVMAFMSFLAAWPLIWFDPDELFLVISQAPGEVMSWAFKASQTCLAISVALVILIVILRKRLESIGKLTWSVRGIGILIWAVMLAAYWFVGQVGFFGEEQFVILKNQADLTSISSNPDPAARRSAVYQTLTDTAATSQKDLRAELDRLGIRYTPYYLVNGLVVQAEPIVGLWLEQRSEVDRVLPNPRLRPLIGGLTSSKGDAVKPTQPEWNLTSIGADKVWQELGITGKGIVVGQSDSGVQADHPELADSYRGNGGSNDYNWLDPWYGKSNPYDVNGHGTHTLGSIVGNSTGVAPDAEWIGCINLARNLGDPGYYLDCMQFMLAPYPQKGDPFKDGKPEMGANVLNNSWGCPSIEGCDSKVFQPAVDSLRIAGVFVVVSAGNNGYGQCGTVKDPPAIYGDVFTVGAVDASGELALFSSQGPVLVDGSGRVKPNLVAPGQDVLSAFPGDSYMTLSGTSMAGPHVVGVVALMWSANPKLVGDVDQTTQLLEKSAKPYTRPLPACVTGGTIPNDAVGYGMLDAYVAVKLALQVK